MNQKTIDKVLKSEERFTTPGTGNEVGTGLGLHLSKSFVELNNGILKIISQPGKGTVIKITFLDQK